MQSNGQATWQEVAQSGVVMGVVKSNFLFAVLVVNLPTSFKTMASHLAKSFLQGYHIDWVLRTCEEDSDIGGYDFKRTEVKGFLKFNPADDILDFEERTVGVIEIVKYHLHYIGNHAGGRNALRDLMEMEDDDDILDTILLDFRLKKETMGDLIIIEKVEIEENHRGKYLGLWLVEAADAVINSYMSLCVLYPRPLYKRNMMAWSIEEKRLQESEFRKGKEKLQRYFSRLGFKSHGRDFMIRWNGYVHPSLDNALSSRGEAQHCAVRKKLSEPSGKINMKE